MKKTFTVITLLMMLLPTVLLAQVQVKGKVSDSKGEGLPGVTVLVKGTNKGTVADFEGNYNIMADESAVLVYSFIGFEAQEEAINGRSIINITLADDSKALEEVVVTAIGIKQQKKKLGYATQEVPMDVIAEASTLNLGNALSGQIAGLTVNNPTGMFQSPSSSCAFFRARSSCGN